MVEDVMAIGPPPCRLSAGEYCPDAVNGTEQIHFDDIAEGFERQLVDIAAAGNAGIEDRRIQPAEPAFGLGDHPPILILGA